MYVTRRFRDASRRPVAQQTFQAASCTGMRSNDGFEQLVPQRCSLREVGVPSMSQRMPLSHPAVPRRASKASPPSCFGTSRAVEMSPGMEAADGHGERPAPRSAEHGWA